jgi:hypothetical protein
MAYPLILQVSGSGDGQLAAGEVVRRPLPYCKISWKTISVSIPSFEGCMSSCKESRSSSNITIGRHVGARIAGSALSLQVHEENTDF